MCTPILGALAARVSSFEMVLTNVLLANAKRSGKVTTDEEFEKMETMSRNGKTLGHLIKAVNAETAIPDLVDKVMTEALRGQFRARAKITSSTFLWSFEVGRA